MPSALYFFQSIFVWRNHSPYVVMMCDEKEYNPQGGSLLACIATQGRPRCTCQPCAIESITPMGYGHTVRFGAIECAIRWGMNTPCDWRELLMPFGWIARGLLVAFGWIVCKWSFCLCGMRGKI